MTIAHLLEDFSVAASGEGPFQLYSEDTLEDLRLLSFEQGYAAGWEDAEKARAADGKEASRAIIQSLEDLTFTFQEVRGQVFTLLDPLFDCLTESILPELAAKGLRDEIVTMLSDAAGTLAEPRATLFVPPGEDMRFSDLTEQSLPMPLVVATDSCLTKDQVILRLGSTETAFDTATLIESVRGVVKAFLFDVQEDVQHG